MALPIVKGVSISGISREILIPCPAVMFKMKRVCDACSGCPHYAGLAEKNNDVSQPFTMRFAIRCAHPIERNTHLLEIIE